MGHGEGFRGGLEGGAQGEDFFFKVSEEGVGDGLRAGEVLVKGVDMYAFAQQLKVEVGARGHACISGQADELFL